MKVNQIVNLEIILRDFLVAFLRGHINAHV
jgi:hypothetical protein